jgi:hypothetical protein
MGILFFQVFVVFKLVESNMEQLVKLVMDLSCPTVSTTGPLIFVHTPFGPTLPEIDPECHTAINAEHAGWVVEFGLTARDAECPTGISVGHAGSVVALGNQTTHIPQYMHRLTHRSPHLSWI